MIRFAYTILYVQDVTTTVEFYENAFGFTRKFITPEDDYAELSVGETTLSFASATFANSNLSNGFIESRLSDKPLGFEIGFTSENVEQTINQAVNAGAIMIEQPTVKPWGQTVAYLRDLNGFLIEICTPLD
jgi:uncharacterized glyoxalase superfamily protein PhnB